jgi:hypothetical protein
MIGRVIFGAVGHNPAALFKLAGRALKHSSSVGKLETVPVDDHAAVIRATEIYVFTECFGIGMAEGALEACGREGAVLQRMHTLTEVDFLVRWALPDVESPPA